MTVEIGVGRLRVVDHQFNAKFVKAAGVVSGREVMAHRDVGDAKARRETGTGKTLLAKTIARLLLSSTISVIVVFRF